MIKIIYGDDTEKTRQIFVEEKKLLSSSDCFNFDIKNTDINELVNFISTIPLFPSKKVVFIEDMLGKCTEDKKDKIINIILSSTDTHFILWESKTFTDQKLRNTFKNPILQKADYPKQIFRLMEAINVSSGNRIQELFRQVLQSVDAEIVFVMLVRQFRLMIMVKDNSEDLQKELASWQIAKLASQVQNIDLVRLKNQYRQLLAIDINIKTGRSPYTLKQLLDIFFIAN